MKTTIWTGILVFIGWAIFSNYWYVCKIKDLCGDELTAVTAMDESNALPDTTAEQRRAKEEAEKEAALIRSIEQSVIYFAFDSSLVLNESQLSNLISEVNTLSPRLIVLEGHCCNIGSEKYNMDLGQRRADRVKTALVNQGISSENINTVSYGEAQPAVPNTSEDNREKNRRVEIIIKEK